MKAWQGQGGYGAVYRAERAGFRRSGPVALKVSLSRWGWRMGREVELLSRLRHPSIPRLLDRGGPSSGAEYPYFVMEWVQGVGLYAWAEQHAPTGRQVCRVLAQLARALEAVHAAGAVHRDVKGDNVLVRRSDGRGMLIDFGSCHFPGAARLTWQSLPPMTPEYFSPQAARFYLRAQHPPEDYYAPSPADDLYALGVTAYRLVMGKYPGRMEARAGSEAAAREERMKARTPRVDGAGLLKRTFDFDVFACVRCGGRRRVLAYVKAGWGVRAILEHVGLPTAGARLAPARGPPQAAWC